MRCAVHSKHTGHHCELLHEEERLQLMQLTVYLSARGELDDSLLL